MKDRTAFLLFAAVLAMAAFSVFPQAGTLAQAPEKPYWSHVQAVSVNGHALGFFDTASGKLYVYDLSARGPQGFVKKPLAILQISTLGQPLKDVTTQNDR